MSKTYIAIVEDDESLCRALSRFLQASGYQPVTYLSAEAFLDDAKKPAFDCLIMDIQLSGMSGISAGEQLASEGSTMPLIYLTAHENWEELKRTIRLPCAGFMHKNEAGENILATIDKAIHSSNQSKPAQRA